MQDSFHGVIAFALLALMLWVGSQLRSRLAKSVCIYIYIYVYISVCRFA